jgi:hypothetical protein
MKNTDKILVAIVLGVVVLVGVAFAIALTRPKPAYQSDKTAEGVAHNYLLAIQQNDYERAYSYLSPTIPGYPSDLDKFIQDIERHSYYFKSGGESVSLEVLSSHVTGNRATVKVRKTVFHQGDLFNSSERTSTFDVSLHYPSKSGEWKITDSDMYWVYCWNSSNGCR